MALGMKARKKGLFGKPFEVPGTPGIGDGIDQMPTGVDPAPGLGMRGEAPEQKMGLGSRLFGQGWESRAMALGGIMRGDTTPLYLMQQEKRAEKNAMAEQAAKMRERSMDLSDWKWKEDYKRENEGPSAPSLREDNAGNVWQFDPQTGMPMGDKPVWVDPTEKIIYQDGMQIRVPNPYRSGGGSSTPSIAPGTVDGGYRFKGGDPADQSNWEPVNGGGPTQPASGGFRR